MICKKNICNFYAAVKDVFINILLNLIAEGKCSNVIVKSFMKFITYFQKKIVYLTITLVFDTDIAF